MTTSPPNGTWADYSAWAMAVARLGDTRAVDVEDEVDTFWTPYILPLVLLTDQQIAIRYAPQQLQSGHQRPDRGIEREDKKAYPD
jgi:hypothetical protein